MDQESENDNKQSMSDWIARQRFEHGLCHQCGNRIYDVVEDSKGRKRYNPISLARIVENGRCLLCYPLTAAGQQQRSDHEGEKYASHGDDDGSSIFVKSITTFTDGSKDNNADDASSITATPGAEDSLRMDRVPSDGQLLQNAKEKKDDAEHVVKSESCREHNEQSAKRARMSTTDIKDSDGMIFVGTIAEGTSEKGRGKFRSGEGDQSIVYEGEFLDGYLHGKGMSHDHRTGCTYEGEFYRGAAHGTGTCTWDKGWKYVGEWSMDKRHGKGQCRQIVDGQGEVYDGEWKDDMWDGKGRLLFSGGGAYTGGFREEKLHGEGTYEFADGSVYRGTFRCDLRHGHGEMTYADGLRYVGEWRNNWRCGLGTLFYSDGSVFKGGFNEDEKDGTGYLHLPDGIVRQERYEMGTLV